jgi:hypothetical protein
VSSLWPIVMWALAGVASVGVRLVRRRRVGDGAGADRPGSMRTAAAGRFGLSIVTAGARLGRGIEGPGDIAAACAGEGMSTASAGAPRGGRARVLVRRARRPGDPPRGPAGR